MTRVFPVPAPARTRRGPSVVDTARRWEVFKPLKNRDTKVKLVVYCRWSIGIELEQFIAVVFRLYLGLLLRQMAYERLDFVCETILLTAISGRVVECFFLCTNY